MVGKEGGEGERRRGSSQPQVGQAVPSGGGEVVCTCAHGGTIRHTRHRKHSKCASAIGRRVRLHSCLSSGVPSAGSHARSDRLRGAGKHTSRRACSAAPSDGQVSGPSSAAAAAAAAAAVVGPLLACPPRRSSSTSRSRLGEQTGNKRSQMARTLHLRVKMAARRLCTTVRGGTLLAW